MNLSLILDAAENKPRGQIDFETLKRDLRDLGEGLRSSFEGASNAIKGTKRFDQPRPQPPGGPPPAQVILPDLAKELKKAVKRVNDADSRKRSLQKAAVLIFTGSAAMAAWNIILNSLTPEMFAEIESAIQQANPRMVTIRLAVFLPFITKLWLLGLLPLAKGVAHLINGIFFAPKPEPESPTQIIYTQPVIQQPPQYASAVPDPSTNDLEYQAAPRTQQSVTEDATLRFEAK
jgi:hypothetical protein